MKLIIFALLASTVSVLVILPLLFAYFINGKITWKNLKQTYWILFE